VLHTSTCINVKERVNLGDNIYISTGVIIAGNVELGDSVTISANSFVNKNIEGSNILVGGTPAKVLKQRQSWYLEDGKEYEQRIALIHELKQTLYGNK
jgi:serine acetyltransferase